MLSDLEIIELKLRLFDLEGELEAIEDNPNVEDYECQRYFLARKYEQKISLALHTATNRRSSADFIVPAVQRLICDNYEGLEEYIKIRIEWYDHIQKVSEEEDDFDSVENVVDVAIAYIRDYNLDDDVKYKELGYTLTELKEEMLKAKENFDEEYQQNIGKVNGLKKKINFLKQTLSDVENRNF